MSSLRARLVVGLLALAAAGLLTLAAVTYAEQRSFQYDRIDDELRGASGPVIGALHRSEYGGLPAGGATRPPAGGDPAGDGDGAGAGGPGSRGPEIGLPSGTYGQRRDANGKVLDEVVLAYDSSSSTAKPKLPTHIKPGRLFTVSGTDDRRFRVLARPDPGGNGTIVTAVPLREVDRTLHRLLLVEALVIAGVLALLALLATFLVRLGLRPLDRMGQTAGAIAGGDLSRRVEPADARSETGRLGLALNAMLERLEAAFAERQASEDRLRAFLADASHELRTPLSSIRGYAELFRIGAARSPEDTEKAMRRIEEEAARMGVLVEDLLTLARLDEVRESSGGAVDLADVVRDVVDDARASAPCREVTAEVEEEQDALVVTGDAHALHQVLANLVRNAIVHTPPDGAIDVRAVREGGDVVLSVRDHGPGLPTQSPDELFQRFWRSEGGRARGRGGAGLGLAIVAGIVERHGGTVRGKRREPRARRDVHRAPAGLGRSQLALSAPSGRSHGRAGECSS